MDTARNIKDVLEAGVAAHQARQFDEALTHYRAALKIDPNDAETLSLTGLLLVHAGNVDQGLEFLWRAVAHEPLQAGFRLNLAEGLEKAGNNSEALTQLRSATTIEPNNAQAWERSGDISALSNFAEGAASAWQRALMLNPQSVSPAFKLAQQDLSRGRFESALKHVQAAAAISPDDPALPAYRSEALTGLRDWQSLHELATSWTNSNPGEPVAWRNLARAEFELGYCQEAVNAFGRVLAISAPDALDFAAFAGLCLPTLAYDNAASALQKAEQLNPDLPEVHVQKAMLSMFYGRFDEAVKLCRRCLAIDAENTAAYSTLSRLQRGSLSNEDLQTLTRISRSTAILDQRIPAAFALAHALDARQEFDAAFDAYGYAHALCLERDQIEGRRFERAEFDRQARRLVASFPMERHSAERSVEWPRPIFVVGMPRSGTTLVERVIGAHSRVFACGERPTMRQILQTWLLNDVAGTPVDDNLAQRWAAQYFLELPDIAPADHVTDKHPLNFESIGLIASLFPNAIIVDVRRNPLESCLSTYRQEFSKHWSFVHRLEDIAYYYGRYARLMAHWEKGYAGRLVSIQYEDFANDFATAAPKLIAACGLEWQPQCLDFQRTPDAIATFSTVQVRDTVKIQNGRALSYAKHLSSLMASLESLGIDLRTGRLPHGRAH